MILLFSPIYTSFISNVQYSSGRLFSVEMSVHAYTYFTEKCNPRRASFSAFSRTRGNPLQVLFSDFTTRTTTAINKFMARHTCMQMCLPNPALPSPALCIPPHHDRLCTGTRPPALICPICRVRVRNNKSAAKNKRCENCCQFAEAPPAAETAAKYYFSK